MSTPQQFPKWSSMTEEEKRKLAKDIVDTLPSRPSKFLEDYYRDLGAEMRWRRDTEYKLLTIYLALVGVAFAALIQSADKTLRVQLFATISGILFVVTVGSKIKSKIDAEHEKHASIGQRMVRIWDEWNLFSTPLTKDSLSILSQPDRGYGEGPGYIKTKSIMNTAMGVYLLVAIFHLGAVFLCCIASLCTHAR